MRMGEMLRLTWIALIFYDEAIEEGRAGDSGHSDPIWLRMCILILLMTTAGRMQSSLKKLLREKDLDRVCMPMLPARLLSFNGCCCGIINQGSFKSGNGSTFIYPGQILEKK